VPAAHSSPLKIPFHVAAARVSESNEPEIVSSNLSEVQGIHETYNAWVEAANEKDIAKWSTFLADDPYFSPADSGEMAWARGICNATFTGTDGKKASGTSRWFKVWVRRSGGSWRGRVNTWKFVEQT
jgi:ketosteroid isomerase-like protein